MAVEVRLGQLGESVVEGTVARWLVVVGERVNRDQPLLEVETDKATVEVPSPAAGVLLRRVAEQGAVVKVGELLGQVGQIGQIGEIDGEAHAAPESRHSPAVRRLAEEHGIDLSRLKGTGAGGRITKEDVLGAIAPKAAQDDFEIVPWSSRRKLIAEHMVASRRVSAHAACVTEVDFSRVMETREKGPSPASLTASVGVAVCRALGETDCRVLNATVENEKTLLHKSVHLAIAVDATEGLMAPVIRNAQRLGVAELDAEIARLAQLVRNNRVRPDDLRGGTFTLSNPGKRGNLFGIAILNQPQVAILRMGELVKRAVVSDEGGNDRVVVRPRMFLALSYDHRVVDGRPANHFLHRVRDLLEGV